MYVLRTCLYMYVCIMYVIHREFQSHARCAYQSNPRRRSQQVLDEHAIAPIFDINLRMQPAALERISKPLCIRSHHRPRLPLAAAAPPIDLIHISKRPSLLPSLQLPPSLTGFFLLSATSRPLSSTYIQPFSTSSLPRNILLTLKLTSLPKIKNKK